MFGFKLGVMLGSRFETPSRVVFGDTLRVMSRALRIECGVTSRFLGRDSASRQAGAGASTAQTLMYVVVFACILTLRLG